MRQFGPVRLYPLFKGPVLRINRPKSQAPVVGFERDYVDPNPVPLTRKKELRAVGERKRNLDECARSSSGDRLLARQYTLLE